ncbi:MAG: LarC family nickel insertion protein [Candidatus Competibacterales bacterium]
MHLHLDPLGGIAGDMFCAALLDAWPAWEPELLAVLQAAEVDRLVSVARVDHRDHTFWGSRFVVRPVTPAAHHHRSFADLRRWLEVALPETLAARALAIFTVLAEAEAQVHGVDVDQVHFHEVGAWDSIADIVAAAWRIERLDASWSCASIPLGRGQIDTAHGPLPLPAPATVKLLEGFPVHQDHLVGERVTPTGAAILRHLNPCFEPLGRPWRLNKSGVGFGTKAFPGLSNCLRVLAFDPVPELAAPGLLEDTVAVCQFEIDDQTPEDLAVGLDRLRALEGVLDVSQGTVVGKKGRVGIQVQLLARPKALTQTLTQALLETSTLGVRWQLVQRAIVPREAAVHAATVGEVRLKRAHRPDGGVTVKAEMDDIAQTPGGRREREAQRYRAERNADDDS